MAGHYRFASGISFLARSLLSLGYAVTGSPAIFASFILLLGILILPQNISAQEKNPFAGDPKAAKLGESQFRINCAFCHGLGAKGGGRGPDLTRAQKRHGSTDEDLFHTINEGIPGT